MKKRKLESLQTLRNAKLNSKVKQKSLHSFFGSTDPKKVKEEKTEVKVVDLVSGDESSNEDDNCKQNTVDVSDDVPKNTPEKPEDNSNCSLKDAKFSDFDVDVSKLPIVPLKVPASSGKKLPQSQIASDLKSVDDGKKPCPFYKKIPNTPFVVDAFSYGNIPGKTAYFLSHFHYDHYMGLNSAFRGLIHCNKVTSKLLQLKLKIPESKINVLPMNTSCFVNGVEVMVLDANHCPGSCMFLFIVEPFEIYLHTGDFRASPSCADIWNKLEPYRSRLSKIFLDSTYLKPEYCFPPQREIINKVVKTAADIVQRFDKDKVMFVFGSYTIGKERLYLSVAEHLNLKVSVDKPKFDILQCYEWPEVDKYVEMRSKDATIFVKPMQEVNTDSLRKLCSKMTGNRRFSHVVGFVPTGWTNGLYFDTGDGPLTPSIVDGNIFIFKVPYSEHSSFEELKHFVKFLKPQKIVTTVGKNFSEMSSYVDQWLKESWFLLKFSLFIVSSSF